MSRLPERLSSLYTCQSIETRDGWRLVAHRLAPREPVSPVPVVLVHGHGTGAWTFMGGVGGGLAGALVRAGRDVWAVELRGSNDTTHVRGASNVRISDKLGIDMHALFAHMRAVTGSELVDGVGHSMGGILLSLGALSQPGWPVRRVVTVGSPLALEAGAIPRPLRGLAARFLTRSFGRVRMRGLATHLSRAVQKTWMPVHFHPAHVEETTFRAFLRWGVTDVYGGELHELLRWVDRADPRELLPAGSRPPASRLPVPTRFLVGSQDSLTSPRAVRRTFDAIGSPGCEYLEIGRGTGFSRDYRHLDILLGEAAQREVAPLVVDWLARDLAAGALELAA
jgi:pimeloyl-ACP methyl ester carboxylesterase